MEIMLAVHPISLQAIQHPDHSPKENFYATK
jgi:hypothetical protein